LSRRGFADRWSVKSTETAPSDPRGLELLRLALALVLFGGAALVILHNWLGLGGEGLDDLAGGELYDAVVIAAGIACLLRSRAAPTERTAWLLIGGAVLCWAAGEVYWTAFILDNPEAPYPSPADIGYLVFYPLAYAGLILLVRARAHELDWRLWTDGLIAGLGTAALGAAFVFDFVSERTTGTPLEVATSLAYPLGDIGMLAMIVGVVALTGWRPGRTWSLLLAGLGAMAVADIAYSVQATGGFVPPGNWIDPIYLISAAFLGAILWQPSVESIRPARLGDWRELMVPGLFAGIMICLFAMQYFSATSGLATVLWAATMVAVIIRLAISVRENKALLEQVQTDPLTGLGNRGRMQVDLEQRCAGASEEHPIALLFLDLNGFKSYNDSFGHPEGDKLLTELGQRLSEAVEDDGTAYRIGGDEFCVLLTCPPERFDLVSKAAAEALSAKGPGFDVATAWGRAIVPGEASEPPEALRLADVRMYAQKESRRTVRDGPTLDSLAAASETA
jgi:diguanylate cyclase (GGDEF)-like protein